MNMTEPALFSNGLRGVLRVDVDMRRYTSWRAGGRCARMYQPADLADLSRFMQTLPAEEKIWPLGLGSNLLIRDGGLRGTTLLLHAALAELRLAAEGLIYAQAGVPGAKLARFAAAHNLSGAEFFAGIPGTVGGMLAMNAGCYGSETWERVERVQVINRSGVVRERTPADFEIGYRHVRLLAPDEEFFVGAWLRLPSGDGAAARAAIKSLLARRIASQPLNLPNAGSVFRNPPNDFAARLIEQCGLKGRQIGMAQVAHKHANFIVNLGAATAEDIERLINEVQQTVQQRTGIALQCEVRIIGEGASS
ncbi:MAG: UDP-N-acetylmuramate dehydrogenase [Pseudomonadota bacterium]